MPCWICPGAGRLAALLDTFSFGNRLDLSKLAWALADQAPLFGHGSRMYTNLSTEFFSGANLPNFAHHEYAQAACDYGYAGLGLMLTLLALFLISGLRSVLKLSGEHQRPNPWDRRRSAYCASPLSTPMGNSSGITLPCLEPAPYAAALPARPLFPG